MALEEWILKHPVRKTLSLVEPGLKTAFLLQDLLYETPTPDTARRGAVGIVKNGLFLFNRIVTRCHQGVDQLLTSNTDVQSNIFVLEGSSVSLMLQKGSDAFW